MTTKNLALLALSMLLAPTAFAQDAAEDDGWGDETASDEDLAAFEQADASFGTALDILGLSVSWSGYGDLNFQYKFGQPEVGVEGEPDYLAAVDPSSTWDAYHFNPIMGARLSDKAWTELELEIEHGGEVIKVEYALLDYTINDYATLRLGKQLVPIGLYNDVVHPSFRWTQASRPDMMTNALPGVWADIGAQVFGKVPVGGSEIGYAVYTMNGLGGNDLSSAFAGAKPLRGLRDNYVDNNNNKSLGGRLAFTAAKGAPVGETMVSFSGYTGDLDADNDVRLSFMVGALQTKLGPFRLIAEGVQSYLGDQFNATGLGIRSSSTPFESGFYVYPHLKFGKVVGGVRYDRVQWGDRADADPTAGPKVGKITSDIAATVKYDISTFWNVRGEFMMPFKEVKMDDNRTVAARAKPPGLQVVSAFYW